MTLPSFLGPAEPIASQPIATPDGIAGTATAALTLAFSMQSQLQSEWCWAAVTSSVSGFFRDSHVNSQCELATQYLNTPCCVSPLPGPPPPTWTGNRCYSLDVPLTVLGHLDGALIPAAISFESVVQAIKAGHPVCCHIQWESSGAAGGHFNAIVGYDAGSRDVVVADPESSYGVCTVPYDAFLANYHGGSWDQTCLTR